MIHHDIHTNYRDTTNLLQHLVWQKNVYQTSFPRPCKSSLCFSNAFFSAENCSWKATVSWQEHSASLSFSQVQVTRIWFLQKKCGFLIFGQNHLCLSKYVQFGSRLPSWSCLGLLYTCHLLLHITSIISIYFCCLHMKFELLASYGLQHFCSRDCLVLKRAPTWLNCFDRWSSASNSSIRPGTFACLISKRENQP